MPTVRTKCPTCDIVIVDANAMTLRRRPDATHTEASFLCPDCVTPVVQPLSDKMVPVLLGAGCAVEDWVFDDLGLTRSAQDLHPSNTGAITEDEIADFLAGFDADDWFDELLED